MTDLQKTLNILAEAELWDDLFNSITGPTAKPSMPDSYFRMKRALTDEAIPGHRRGRRRGRRKEELMVFAEQMARDLLDKDPRMTKDEAIKCAVENHFPDDNDTKKRSRISTLKRTLAPSGKRL